MQKLCLKSKTFLSPASRAFLGSDVGAKSFENTDIFRCFLGGI